MKFKLGNLYVTRGVASKTEENRAFFLEILDCFARYQRCDWGDMGKEDKYLNDEAVRTDKTRILAAYKTSKGKIYIITELDRSATTILFADEY